MATQFDVKPLGGFNLGQGLNQLASNVGRQNRYEDQQAKLAQQQQEKQEMQGFMRQAIDGDPVAMKEVFVRNPNIGAQLQQIESERQAKLGLERKQLFDDNNFDYAKRVRMASPEELPVIIQQAIDDPNSDLYDQDDLNISEDEAKLDANMALYSRVGDKGYEAMFGGQPETTKYQQGTGKLSGYSFNPDTGEYAINQDIKQKLEEVKSSPALDAKTRQSINKDFTQLTKDTKLIKNTAKDLEKLSKIKSGPASIAMVFKFMKALDPTSVVREGEFATAENSAGIPESLRNTYNKLMEGGRLGEKQSQQFVDTAKQLANSAIEASTTEVQSFIDTFEDTLPQGFKSSLKGRIPKMFDVKSAVKAAPSAGNQDVPESDYSGYKVIR